MKLGLKGGISIDADSVFLRDILWCCGSICHVVLILFRLALAILRLLKYFFTFCRACNRFFFLSRKIWPAQVVYAISILSFSKALLKGDISNFYKAVLPILAVITPAHNMILLPIHIILERIIRDSVESKSVLTAYYFFGWAIFFQMVSSFSYN